MGDLYYILNDKQKIERFCLFSFHYALVNDMPPCSAVLSPRERQILRTLLAQESQIVDQCNKHISQFVDILNELQCIHHVHDLEERALKYDEFVRTHARLDCDMTNCDMIPGAVQISMTCNCICIQAACFRMLYKWIPKLDILRMKLLKIKTMCSTIGSNSGGETCTRIEKTAQNAVKLKLKTASH